MKQIMFFRWSQTFWTGYSVFYCISSISCIWISNMCNLWQHKSCLNKWPFFIMIYRWLMCIHRMIKNTWMCFNLFPCDTLWSNQWLLRYDNFFVKRLWYSFSEQTQRIHPFYKALRLRNVVHLYSILVILIIKHQCPSLKGSNVTEKSTYWWHLIHSSDYNITQIWNAYT